MDRKFHYMIAEMAGNPLITSSLNATEALIESLIANIRLLIINDTNSSQQIDNQHLSIVKAISEHDPIAAAAAMDEHMKLVSKLVEQNMK